MGSWGSHPQRRKIELCWSYSIIDQNALRETRRSCRKRVSSSCCQCSRANPVNVDNCAVPVYGKHHSRSTFSAVAMRVASTLPALHVIRMDMSSSSLLDSSLLNLTPLNLSLLDEPPDKEPDKEPDKGYCAAIIVYVARRTVCLITAHRRITRFLVETYGMAVRFLVELIMGA